MGESFSYERGTPANQLVLVQIVVRVIKTLTTLSISPKQSKLLYKSSFDPVTLNLEETLSDCCVQLLALYPCIWARNYVELLLVSAQILTNLNNVL